MGAPFLGFFARKRARSAVEGWAAPAAGGSPALAAIPSPYSIFHASWTEQSLRRKTDLRPPKMRSRFFQSACYRWLHEVVHQQQLPVVRPRSLHHRNPLHFLPMRFETHLDAKRNHTRAENSPGSRQEDRLIVALSRSVLRPRELTNSRDSEPPSTPENQKHYGSPTSGDGFLLWLIGTRPSRPWAAP